MAIKLIDFDRQWGEIRATLNRPRVAGMLDLGMALYCVKECGGIPWNPDIGPWWYGTAFDKIGVWEPFFAYDWCDAQAEYRAYRGDDLPTQPERGSPDWYRCWRACHWLVGWCCAIGKELMPDLEWNCVTNKEHSTAIGKRGKSHFVIDILAGHNTTPMQVMNTVLRGDPTAYSLDIWADVETKKLKAS